MQDIPSTDKRGLKVSPSLYIRMNADLEKFFKDTPLGIKSVLQSAVLLAEKVNTRTDLSGKEKTELVVKTLKDFLGEGNPELLALVDGVIPGMLEVVISTARGKYMLKQVTSCLPYCVPSAASDGKGGVLGWLMGAMNAASTPAVTIREASPPSTSK
jgi:hypothetical protein